MSRARISRRASPWPAQRPRSSYRPPRCGEVGLAGEIRSVNQMQQRLDEAAKLGFKQAVVPKLRGSNIRTPKGMKLQQIRNLREGLETFYLVV